MYLKNPRARRRRNDDKTHLVFDGEAFEIDALTDLVWRYCEQYPDAATLTERLCDTGVQCDSAFVSETLVQLEALQLLQRA